MSSLVGSLPDAVACDLMLFMSLRSCDFMGSRTHQNISKTELIYHPEKAFQFPVYRRHLCSAGSASSMLGLWSAAAVPSAADLLNTPD